MPKNDDPEFNIGDLAEAEFNRWCQQVKIMASPPGKDRHGWDYHLNLPETDQVDLFTAPPALSANVQIKGHLGDDPDRPAIALSNWQRMIREPVPWFVCVVLLDKHGEAIRAALIHVDKERVEKAAERIWKNQASEKKALHELTMTCSWSKEHILPTLHGRSLLEAMRKQIGDPRDYFKKKQDWLENAGLAPGRHSVSVKWGPEATEQDLCDFALGKREKISASKLEVSEVRFGIALKRKDYENVEVAIPGSRSVGETLARITSATPPRSAVEIRFETLSSSSMFPFLSKPYQVIRLVAPFITAEIHPNDQRGTLFNWSFNIKQGVPSKFSELERAARAAMALLETPRADIELILPPDGRRQVLPPGSDAQADAQPQLRELLETIVNAGHAARVFERNLDEIITTTEELTSQWNEFGTLASLYSGTTPNISLKMLNIGEDGAKFANQDMARVVPVAAYLGEYCLLSCVALTGVSRLCDDGVSIELDNIKVEEIERLVVDKRLMSEDEANERLKKMMERGREDQRAKGRELITDPNDP
jgi:hypothetical protein